MASTGEAAAEAVPKAHFTSASLYSLKSFFLVECEIGLMVQFFDVVVLFALTFIILPLHFTSDSPLWICPRRPRGQARVCDVSNHQ